MDAEMSETTHPVDEPSAGGPPGPSAARRDRGDPPTDKRAFVLAGAVILGIIAILGVVTTFMPEGPRKDTNVVLQEQGGAKPHIIPRPNDGKAPNDPGERGGALQYLLAGLLFSAVLGGGTYVWWSGAHPRGSGEAGAGRSLSRRRRTNG